MDLGFMYIDILTVISFFEQPAIVVVFELFAIVGWIILVWLLAYAGIHLYAEYVEEKNTHHWKFTLLAIDIPQENVQTPKAVEQMFSHIAGAFEHPDLRGKFREGYKQKWFSFEIISIEGYIQFLVWTEQTFRDLVEASVYAQYPDAEITEVEDYVTQVPDKYPNDTHDIWIGDFSLAEHDAFPIRSYREFEHSISKDTVLKDPMGTFLESFTRIGYGEQMWFQILVQPTDNHWKEKSIEKIKELIGEKKESHKSKLNFLTENFITKEVGRSLEELNAQLTGGIRSEGGESSSSDHEEKNQLKYLTPGQSKLIEAMEEKIAKIGFKVKMRGVYVARKEVFNTARGVNALVGAINQFNIPTANSIVPKSTTNIRNKNKKIHKQNHFFKAYKKRKIKAGANPCVLNIEELATLWHFPMSHVKTPQVQKASSKVAEPPIGLPVEGIGGLPTVESTLVEEKHAEEKRRIVTDTGEEIKFDD